MGTKKIPFFDFSAVLDKLQAIADNVHPTASGTSITPTGMHIVTEGDVQGAISELDSAVDSVNSSLAQKTGTLTLGNGTITLCQDRKITTAVVTASATTNLIQGTWTNADLLPSGLSKFDFLAICLSSGNLILRVSGSNVQYYWANSGTGVWLQGSGATTNSMA